MDIGALYGPMDAAKDLEDLCQAGSIRISLRLLADGRFEIRHGDYLRDVDFHGYAESFEEAVALLKKAVEPKRRDRGLAS